MSTAQGTTTGTPLGTHLREPREVIREEPLMHRPILAALADGPLTIPEIAERIGAPAQETVYWVMGMLRYSHLVELEDASDEGYYSYAIAGQEVGE